MEEKTTFLSLPDLEAGFVKRIIETKPVSGVVINVNIPSIPEEEIVGVEVCPQGASVYVDEYKLINDFGDTLVYENYGDKIRNKGQSLEDDHIIDMKKISITPLHFNMTHNGSLGVLSKLDFR